MMRQRSRLTSSMVFLIVALLVAACGGGGKPIAGQGAAPPSSGGEPAKPGGKVKVTFFIWAGSNQGVLPREVAAEYLKTHPNVEIEFLESSNAETYPKMVAAKKTTPNNPLVSFGFYNIQTVSQGVKDDMWEAVNQDRIPNMNNTLPALQRADKLAVPYQISVMGLLYNTEKVKEPPTSWADLWDTKFRGRVTNLDGAWTPLVMAAKLNGGSEKNMDPGFKVWADNAKNWKALPTTSDAVKNLLVSGDATIAPWYGSISKVWIKEGAPLAYVTPKEGPVAFPMYLAISKGVKPEQRAVAEEIMNMLLTPEAAGRFANLTYTIPAVNNAIVSDELRNDPNLSPQLAAKVIQLDWVTMGEQNAAWRERWEKEVKTKM